MLAIGADQEPALIRALWVGENDRNVRQSRDFRRTDVSNLPGDGRIVAEHLEEEGIDCVLGGKNRCDLRSIGRGFCGPRLESGRGLSESDAGQQKNSERCAGENCHIWNSWEFVFYKH